jgi:L-alanine-DL-glutamate epimerase-like enolase superfamily enzyme
LRDIQYPDPGAIDRVLRRRVPHLSRGYQRLRSQGRPVQATDRPGLGIEIDEKRVEAAGKRGFELPPAIQRYDDGSYAEI